MEQNLNISEMKDSRLGEDEETKIKAMTSGEGDAIFEFEIKKVPLNRKNPGAIISNRNQEDFATFGKPEGETQIRTKHTQSQRQSEPKRRAKLHQDPIPFAYQFHSPNKGAKRRSKDSDKAFVKDVESISILLKEANQMKKELSQFKKTEAHLGIVKKLYVMTEENRRLKMENARLKSELASPFSMGSYRPDHARVEPQGQNQSQMVMGRSAESVNKTSILERENRDLKRQMQRMQEMYNTELAYQQARILELSNKVSKMLNVRDKDDK